MECWQASVGKRNEVHMQATADVHDATHAGFKSLLPKSAGKKLDDGQRL
jgi:hypothetical protein